MGSLFRINASEITDTCLDISLLQPKETPILLEKLSEATSVENQIRLISDFLLTIASKDNSDLILQQATETIIRYNGEVILTDLHKNSVCRNAHLKDDLKTPLAYLPAFSQESAGFVPL